MLKNTLILFLIFIMTYIPSCSSQENPPLVKTPEKKEYTYEVIIDGINIPWGFCFISNNKILVTEKSGKLFFVEDSIKQEISGLPEVYVRGQGGLLDVAIHPDFKINNLIYFTLSTNIEDDIGGNTALYQAKLIDKRLEDLKLLYKAVPNTKKAQHFGSRIVFDKKGHVFFTIGDRGNRDLNPQDLTKDGGKVYRLNLDGSIPTDNPFFSEKSGTKKAIFSYGHRNPQGMIIHPESDKIWLHEHGPRGGDEINIVEYGKNYGWPKITYGVNYSGTTITKNTSLPGLEQPLYYWVPSIAPSGMAFSTSDVYKNWKGNLFIGSLKYRYLERLVIKNKKVIEREKILENVGRVRDVREGPDGYLYIAVEGKGILKIVQKK
mgnify:FL=1